MRNTSLVRLALLVEMKHIPWSEIQPIKLLHENIYHGDLPFSSVSPSVRCKLLLLMLMLMMQAGAGMTVRNRKHGEKKRKNICSERHIDRVYGGGEGGEGGGGG